MIIFTHYPEYIEVVVEKKSDRTCKHWFCDNFSMSDGSDEEIFFEQHCDMDYIFSAAYATLRKYAKENGMQLEEEL